MTTLHHVILDTDLGSDVDDAMALAQILGTPSINLVGVTTVYGDTLLRARLVQRYAALAGHEVTAYVGETATLSGREVWWPGHEGSLHPELEKQSTHEESAVEFLVRSVLERPGEIDVIAIGPLTNIAAAITADERFAGAVKHLWIMGGAFEGEDAQTEHNFRSDDIASSIVFGAGIPTTVTGLEITRKVEIRRDQLAEIAASGPLGSALEADIRQWWAFWNEEWNVPHDPITVLTMTEPELFEFSPLGTIAIELGGEHAGRSIFTPSANGTTRVSTSIDGEAAAASLVAAIRAA